MKILTKWLRAYLPSLPVDDEQLAEDLTLRGIAVEGIFSLGEANGSLYEMDITTNRVDAMNHYGIAREAATIYGLPLEPLHPKLPVGTLVDDPFPVRIAPEAKGLCGRFTAQILRGVTIAPSSGRVADYFSLLGQKPISNAVHPRVRPRQDRRRHRHPARPQRREAAPPRRHRAHPRTR